MAVCRSCKAANPSERDLWACPLCDEPICDRCYVEHTDDKHFAELYPAIDKKRKNDACCEYHPTIEVMCEERWGHAGDHRGMYFSTGEVIDWERR